jgi:hypothetical protein
MRKSLLPLLAMLCASAMLLGDEPKEPYEGPVVVLKNGTVLRGRGVNLGEKVAVELGDKTEVKLPKGQVELIADSIDDAYLQRREKLMPENVLSQLSLAHWCYDQGLKTEAMTHLRAARKVDPTHPGISRLERKIRELERIAQEELPEPKTEQLPGSQIKELLKERIESQKINHRVVAGDISPALKTRFNKEVQPILLGSCAASKCHGPNSGSDFRLVRSSAHSENHSVLVKRNLQTVLSRLDADTPEESLLLTKGAEAHAAGMRSAPMDLTSREFGVLIDWVIGATEELKAPRASMNSPIARAPATMPGATSPRSPSSEDPRAEDDEPNDRRTPRGDPRIAEKPPKNGAAKRGSGKTPSMREEEPGDPEEFNQRYFPREPPREP